MSFYMIVNSQQSASVFPDNKPFHFFTHLKLKLALNGVWKVALIDIKIPLNNHIFEQKDVYSFSNMCGESIIDGVYKPLLRRVCLSSSESDFFFLSTHLLRFSHKKRTVRYRILYNR